MKLAQFTCISILFLSIWQCSISKIKQENFTELRSIIPSIHYDIRYYSDNNFIGDKIEGYKRPACYLTNEAAAQLKKVEYDLNQIGMGLIIYDCYRPQTAVNHFVRWAQNEEDTLMKTYFYPKVPKSELFKQGYIADKSGHSRGSTVDLGLIELSSNEILDMGSPFDYFDPLSHTMNDKISDSQLQNRLKLKSVMEKYGFKNYASEWWHYTLINEPFPNEYFDFNVN